MDTCSRCKATYEKHVQCGHCHAAFGCGIYCSLDCYTADKATHRANGCLATHSTHISNLREETVSVGPMPAPRVKMDLKLRKSYKATSNKVERLRAGGLSDYDWIRGVFKFCMTAAVRSQLMQWISMEHERQRLILIRRTDDGKLKGTLITPKTHKDSRSLYELCKQMDVAEDRATYLKYYVCIVTPWFDWVVHHSTAARLLAF